MKMFALVLSAVALFVQCGFILFGLHTATDFTWTSASIVSSILFACSFLFETQRGYVMSRNLLGAVLCYFSLEYGVLIWFVFFVLVPLTLGKIFNRYFAIG